MTGWRQSRPPTAASRIAFEHGHLGVVYFLLIATYPLRVPNCEATCEPYLEEARHEEISSSLYDFCARRSVFL